MLASAEQHGDNLPLNHLALLLINSRESCKLKAAAVKWPAVELGVSGPRSARLGLATWCATG